MFFSVCLLATGCERVWEPAARPLVRCVVECDMTFAVKAG